MSVLEVRNLTKDYGHGRGVFDISFSVEKGEVFGFLGPNGAGKTTTIRHIMGFSKPGEGTTSVNGRDCWTNYCLNQKELGYLPGEIALPESLTGTQFIKMMADLRGISDMSYTNYLIEKFELDPKGGLKRMSLGMKRKLAVVTAFMHDPDVLVLDEPTSGLDPVMQEVFIEFIKEEKKRGKTILLSSHIFSEVDATCDRIAIIKDGEIVSTVVAEELKHSSSKTFKLELTSNNDFTKFIKVIDDYDFIELVLKKAHKNQVKVLVDDCNINQFFNLVSQYELKFLSEIKFTLEDYFMEFYDRNTSHEKEVQ